ncbi:hypothetical protein [Methanocaldococcus infernus]
MNSSLESLIQGTAFNIVNKKILDRKSIEKLLGILANDGVYAMWVFAKSENEINEEEFMNSLKDLLSRVEPKSSEEDWEKYLQRVSENIYKLLFLKQVLEKVLIYARYHARALSD